MIACVKKENTFYLISNDEILWAGTRIAIVFSQDDEFWTLHKLGGPEQLEKYFQDYQQKLKEKGLLGKLGNFIYLELPNNISVEEISLLLEDPSYLESFVKTIGHDYASRCEKKD
jgi:hypothetical protein